MSNDVFEDGKYDDSFGTIYPCRVQPETKALTIDGVANAYPTGSVTANAPSVKISSSRSGLGVIPRQVTIELTANGAGAVAGYRSGTTHDIVWFDATTFDAVAKQQTGTYLGIACKVNGKKPQIIR